MYQAAIVDDELDIDWNDFKDELDQIGDKYDRTVGGYFFCAKPLSKYNGQTLLEHITCLEYIDDVISEICTGKDAGCDIRRQESADSASLPYTWTRGMLPALCHDGGRAYHTR